MPARDAQERRSAMRFLLVFTLIGVVLIGLDLSAAASEEAEAKKGDSLEKLLTTYLRNRLEAARLSLKSVQGLHETGVVTVPEVLAAEDEVDRWRLHLHLATEEKLIAFHPVFGEVRREFGVPEISKSLEAMRRKVTSALICDYLQKRLGRAERGAEAVLALRSFGRATESEVLAAKTKVDGLRLLLEAERISSREGGT
jgi:hypothetical protein